MFAALLPVCQTTSVDQLRWSRHHGLMAFPPPWAPSLPTRMRLSAASPATLGADEHPELSTCMQYGVPIKIISINKRALGMVKQWQKMFYGGRHSHLHGIPLPDPVKLAEAYGPMSALRVSDPAGWRERHGEGLCHEGQTMDISVDRTSTSIRCRSNLVPWTRWAEQDGEPDETYNFRSAGERIHALSRVVALLPARLQISRP